MKVFDPRLRKREIERRTNIIEYKIETVVCGVRERTAELGGATDRNGRKGFESRVVGVLGLKFGIDTYYIA